MTTAKPELEGVAVVHVVEAALGGVRRYFESMLAASEPLGLRQFVVYSPTRADPQFWAVLESMCLAGWTPLELPMTRSISPRADLGAVMRLRSALSTISPDIVYCHSSKAGGVGRLASATMRHRPALMYAPHALAIAFGRPYQAIEQMLSRRTEVITAISESESAQIVRAGLTPREIRVVPPTIDGSMWAPIEQYAARTRLGWDPDEVIVAGIGRMAPQKDPEAFVAIVAEAGRALGRPARAVWVGAGELERQCRALAGRLGVSLEITGWQDDVRPFVAGSDVVVVPSRYESFGFATAEALAMERPVVGTNVAGTVDVLRNCGALFEVGDNLGAGRMVAELVLTGRQNPAAWRALRESVLRRFSEAMMRDRLRSAYVSALRWRPSLRVRAAA
jgi:glycosyltransferase involved in cell wall biosynthesis